MFRALRSLPVAHASCRDEALPSTASGYHRDTLTLGWEERLRARARRVSDQGFEFATVLERGQILRDGDCFVFDEPGRVVRVVEQAEPVFVIRPRTAREGAFFTYHIGNSHQPLMLVDAEIVCPDVPGMEQVLSYHGMPFIREHRPFTPVGQTPDHRHQVTP
jgi:urease accessory protein